MELAEVARCPPVGVLELRDDLVQGGFEKVAAVDNSSGANSDKDLEPFPTIP